MSENKVMTLRLPSDLMTEGEAYARAVGLSVNGLMGVALRDYLDARRRTLSSVLPSPAVAPALPVERQPLSLPAALAAPGAALKAPKNPRAPCPCGSRQQWRHCHGKGT